MHIDAAPDRDLCPTGCSGRSYLARHTGWYRKHFALPAGWAESHISLEFEGAFHGSIVYVNGLLLTSHSCGYTSFDVPLAKGSLKFGGEPNVIAVYVDATSGTGWWYEGGGLFRHVWLVKRSPVHLATWGVFVAPKVDGGTITATTATTATTTGWLRGGLTALASLNITAVATSAPVAEGPLAAAAQQVQVHASFELIDAAGVTVVVLVAPPVAVAPGAEATLHASGRIPARVALWSIPHPTLYTVRARLMSSAATGPVIDETNVTTGFRSLHYDARSGFRMNEQQVKVRGFCDHNDFASVGVAVPDRLNLCSNFDIVSDHFARILSALFHPRTRRAMYLCGASMIACGLRTGAYRLRTGACNLIACPTPVRRYRAQAARSVGGNGRRTSHNPPNPSMLDIYDRVGMVVMAENRDFVAGEEYYQNMASLVQRDRNHPSVTIWCGNF